MGHVIVACGLRREAREIAGDGRIVVVGGGDAARLEAELDRQAATSPVLMLSSGIAGALDPMLRAGDLAIDGNASVVALLRHLILPHTAHPEEGLSLAKTRLEGSFETPFRQAQWLLRMSGEIRRPPLDLITGPIAGTDTILATAAQKRALHAATGAIAADMETHIARRVADRHGLPFAAIRVISDIAEDDLPPAALIGMKPDGGMALGAVLASLARHPAQLPALIRTGIKAEKAFRALGRAHHALRGLRIELADLG